MAWGTLTSLGEARSSGQITTVLSSVNVAKGELIIITGRTRIDIGSFTLTVTDSAGNTYSSNIGTNTANFSPDMNCFVASAPCLTAIVNGTISVDVFNTPNPGTDFEAFKVTGGKLGAGYQDTSVTATKTQTAATAPTITSGAPSVAGDLMVVAYAGSPTTFTEDAGNGWTALNAFDVLETPIGCSAFQINAGTTAKTHTPTTSSAPSCQVVVGFKVGAQTLKTVTATEGNTMSMTRALGFGKTITATVVNTVTKLVGVLFGKTISATNAATMTMALISAYMRSITATEGSTMTMARALIRVCAVSATEASTMTMTRVKAFLRTITASASNSFSLARVAAYARTITAQCAMRGILNFKDDGTGTDTQLWAPVVSLNGTTYYRIRARIRPVNGAPSWEGKIYYSTGGHGFSESFIKVIPAPTGYASGVWATVEWDMSALTAGGTDWITSTITRFRMDFSQAGTVNYEVDWIEVADVSGNAGLRYDFNSGSVEGWTAINHCTVAVSTSFDLTAGAIRPTAISATVGSVFTMLRTTAHFVTITATNAATFAMTRVVAFLKSITASAGSTATVAKPVTRPKTVSATEGSAMTMTRVVAYLKTVSITSATTFTLSRINAFFKTISASAGNTASLTSVRTILKTVAATVGNSASVSMLFTFVKSVSASASSAMSMNRVVARFKTISASVSNSATITAASAYVRSISASVGNAVSLDSVRTILQSVSATVGNLVTLAMTNSFTKTVSAVASSVATMLRNMTFLFSVSVSATTNVVIAAGTNFVRTISAIADSIADILAQGGQTFLQTITATADTLMDLAKTFIAFVASALRLHDTDIDNDITDKDDKNRQ